MTSNTDHQNHYPPPETQIQPILTTLATTLGINRDTHDTTPRSTDDDDNKDDDNNDDDNNDDDDDTPNGTHPIRQKGDPISHQPTYHPYTINRMRQNTPIETLPPEIHVTLDPLDHMITITKNNAVTSQRTRTVHRMKLISKDAIQGDTGANCSATNNRNILWDYKTLPSPIPIVTYQDDHTERFEAIGTGIIKMIVNDNTLSWLTLYTPKATGTIISPDRFMNDNGKVYQFQHTGRRDNRAVTSRLLTKKDKPLLNLI
jgi:hypothetical protein